MKRLSFLCCLFLGTTALASDPMADATAKFLAGLPVRGTPLEKHSSGTMWVTHATEFDRAWERLEQRQLARIRNWAPSYLAPAYEENGPMFYMFSGPDFLYANAFFPNASTYILCGIEPVGPVPDIDKIPDSVLPSALANLRKSLDSVLSFSFFITKNMKVDLKQTQLNGTLPVLYVFLARAGCTIDSVTPVALDKAGSFVPEGKGATSGVKIVFFEPDGREKTLYYFTSDLADWAVKVNPGFLKFCEAQGQGVALLKAASYLMHSNNFSQVRDFLLGHSKLILQDDSGIPFHFFDADKWNLRHVGRYIGPINRFLEHGQLDLAKQNGATNPPPLDFSFGYQWQPSRSSLMIATPKD
ncbi:MAG: hypothetical protein DMF06_04450 [Verrucomicrobia bacterium]|nr:MAG: hypothetical protein DMF06_04450 [Verrucomicrobiota bacterium]